MRIADADILVLPGLGNSGAGHWQRRWAERFSTGRIVEQDDWDNPDIRDWTAAIVEAVEMAERPVVLIAHSLAVSALVHAAPRFPKGKVKGAFLVSPPDHEGKAVPREAQSFAGVPLDPLPFPSLLVVSNTDPMVSLERAAHMAAAWGSELHFAGDAGHINLQSGHGPWPEGLLMFTRLMQRI
ncbi:MAG: serine hydrolase family protein [Devosia sp.]|uniref:RBBP9/YdeN family alpha/beta hydrolase n=1 Tax=Devosia sp. TaxID=1871048 RepID=UPI001ACFA683|nr:alpha/beta hydrolase [Devosia sp.]MBN9316110.1 serine hydrolase family protein [Devosia sp.]